MEKFMVKYKNCQGKYIIQIYIKGDLNNKTNSNAF